MLTDWVVGREEVRHFEDVVFDAIATPMRVTVENVPANPDGYAV